MSISGWGAVVSLFTGLIRLATSLGAYFAGRRSVQAEEAEAENEARKKMAEAAAGAPHSPGDLADRLRKDRAF